MSRPPYVHIGFEHLQPGKKITNIMFLELLASDPLDIYVNPAMGNDSYSGLSASKPKQTI